MDYKRIHDSIIERAKNELRVKGSGVYYESHHIIPKCLGGSGHQSQWRFHKNLVLLTAKEHFLIHRLLCKIYPNNKEIIYAYWCICTRLNSNRIKPSVRAYEEARVLFCDINSKQKKGNTYRLGIGFSEKSKQKISKTLTGRKQDIVECPHCKLVGGDRALKQFHFDNCLKKPGNENIIRTRKSNKTKDHYIKCLYCDYSSTKLGIEKYHIHKCKNNPNKKPKKSSISKESNKKRSLTMMGKNTGPQPKIQCPHCKTIGGQSVMYRHHFSKCKLINDKREVL